MSKKEKIRAKKKIQREKREAEAQATEATLETKRKAKVRSGGRPTSPEFRHEFE